MLFNSLHFIFIFLPITVFIFYLIGSRGHHRIAIGWLICLSLLFYGWWNPIYVLLLLGSILFNYFLSATLAKTKNKTTLVIGVAVNLFILGYFKYANFFIDNINALIDVDIFLERIILPLAISFFTFQQITFLVDSYRGKIKDYSFLYYSLFVTFFPQLIAGPIVHHQEVMPQFLKKNLCKLKSENLAVGASIFIIGLFKKTVIADSMAVYANPVFKLAEGNSPVIFMDAWGGAIAYTFQLYFDFSGYSDMAIGLSRMFGIILPTNFFSPYKATNIIEFWRRWHMTLSRFFRDYLYISFGGNRKGTVRNILNLITTMLLAGLWHGASWTFVIWGGIHGACLVINHGFQTTRCLLGHNLSKKSFFGSAASWTLTFSIVIITWSIFRAESINGAQNMIEAMLGINGFILPELIDYHFWAILCILLFIVCLMPSTQEFLVEYKPTLEIYSGHDETKGYHWIFRYKLSNFAHNLLIVLMGWLCFLTMLAGNTTNFVYGNF
jgi:alginate O-acetyltransferase complex protein AlgI